MAKQQQRVETANNHSTAIPLIVLTPRQMQVLSLVADGLLDKEISASLRISERTVRFHLTELFRIVGARNRAQLAALSTRRAITSTSATDRAGH